MIKYPLFLFPSLCVFWWYFLAFTPPTLPLSTSKQDTTHYTFETEQITPSLQRQLQQHKITLGKGSIGQGIVFQATQSQALRLPERVSTPTSSSVWFYLDNSNNNSSIVEVISTNQGNNPALMKFWIDSRLNSFKLTHQSNTKRISARNEPDFELKTQQWYHFSAVWDADSIWCYLQGKPFFSANHSPPLSKYATYQMVLGSNQYTGQFDEVSLYPTTFSPQEIKHLYQSKRPKKPSSKIIAHSNESLLPVFNQRQHELQDSFATKHNKVKLFIKDYGEVDGDVVGIAINNNTWKNPRLPLKREAVVEEFTLETGKENHIIFYAREMGAVPTINTASVRVEIYDMVTNKLVESRPPTRIKFDANTNAVLKILNTQMPPQEDTILPKPTPIEQLDTIFITQNTGISFKLRPCLLRNSLLPEEKAVQQSSCDAFDTQSWQYALGDASMQFVEQTDTAFNHSVPLFIPFNDTVILKFKLTTFDEQESHRTIDFYEHQQQVSRSTAAHYIKVAGTKEVLIPIVHRFETLPIHTDKHLVKLPKKNQQVYLDIKDYERIDGDVVSIQLNGQAIPIFQNYTLTNQFKSSLLHLNTHRNNTLTITNNSFGQARTSGHKNTVEVVLRYFDGTIIDHFGVEIGGNQQKALLTIIH